MGRRRADRRCSDALEHLQLLQEDVVRVYHYEVIGEADVDEAHEEFGELLREPSAVAPGRRQVGVRRNHFHAASAAERVNGKAVDVRTKRREVSARHVRFDQEINVSHAGSYVLANRFQTSCCVGARHQERHHRVELKIFTKAFDRNRIHAFRSQVYRSGCHVRLGRRSPARTPVRLPAPPGLLAGFARLSLGRT